MDDNELDRLFGKDGGADDTAPEKSVDEPDKEPEKKDAEETEPSDEVVNDSPFVMSKSVDSEEDSKENKDDDSAVSSEDEENAGEDEDKAEESEDSEETEDEDEDGEEDVEESKEDSEDTEEDEDTDSEEEDYYEDEDEETDEEEQTAQTAAPTSGRNSSGKLSDYVRDARSEYNLLEQDGEYHVPKVVFKTEYAAQMKQEIDGCFAVYAEEIADNGYSHYYSTHYIAFLSPGGVLSIVFVEVGEWDDDVFHVWNFDVKTGNKVDNSRIAEIAGVRSIRKAGMDAAQKCLNNTGMINVQDYQLVSTDYEYMRDSVANTFSEAYINDNMPVGLTSDGKMFFISPIASFAGAEYYYTMYDINGDTFINDPAWVR